MAGPFREEIIEEIRNRVDMVELVGEYVDLRKQGARFVGCCPFHADKTPSFHVTPENGLFYCFGCGAGGDLFSFIMKLEHLEFPQAVERLAQRAGVSLLQEGNLSPAQQKNLQRLNRLRAVNREAALFYYRYLRAEEGKTVRDYLYAREISGDSQQEFALGFAPRSVNSLQQYLVEKGITQEEMLAAGLLIQRDDGSVIERFRERLMFPITDIRGRVVGFGGRLLGQGEPKYLNSPETKIFRKKGILYGLHLALSVIRQEKVAVLVEGYFDVIALHQHGIKNVVACLGTAFTPEHGSLIKRYVREVLLLFDSDEAGIRATDRAIDIFRDQGLKVRIATLPEAKDPDEFLKNYGGQALVEVLNQALPIIPYRLQRLKSQLSLDEPGNKSVLLKELFPDLAKLTSQVERQEYIHLLAQELNLPEEAIRDDFRRKQGEQRENYRYTRDKSPEIRNNTKGNVNSFRGPYLMAQENLLRLIIKQPELVFRVEEELGMEIFGDHQCRGVFMLIRELMGKSEEEPIAAVDIFFHAPGNLKDLVARLSSLDSLPIDERQIEDTMNNLQLHYLMERAESKRKLIGKAEEVKDSSGVQNLLQEISDLQRKIHSLKQLC